MQHYVKLYKPGSPEENKVVIEMTGREAAQKILDGVIRILDAYRNEGYEQYYPDYIDALVSVAACIKTAMDEGEYGI